MKTGTAAAFALLATFCVTCFAQAQRAQELTLWYDRPAQNWNEALPVGNGRLGAMIFGDPSSELLQLNEGTLWSGGPINDNPNPLAPALLKQIREAFSKKEFKLAEDLTKKMQGLFTESYLPLGDLRIDQTFNGTTSEYKRTLDIGTATATTTFKAGETEFKREIFSSHPDQVIVVRLTASTPNALQISLRLGSQLQSRVAVQNSTIVLSGRAPSHVDPSYMQTMELPVIYNDPLDCRGMRFECQVNVRTTDGTVSVGQDVLAVKDATEVVLVISAATSFNGFDKCPSKDGKDERAIASGHREKAQSLSFQELQQRHTQDYRSLFDRVSLSINGNPGQRRHDR